MILRTCAKLEMCLERLWGPDIIPRVGNELTALLHHLPAPVVQIFGLGQVTSLLKGAIGCVR